MSIRLRRVYNKLTGGIPFRLMQHLWSVHTYVCIYVVCHTRAPRQKPSDGMRCSLAGTLGAIPSNIVLDRGLDSLHIGEIWWSEPPARSDVTYYQTTLAAFVCSFYRLYSSLFGQGSFPRKRSVGTKQ